MLKIISMLFLRNTLSETSTLCSISGTTSGTFVIIMTAVQVFCRYLHFYGQSSIKNRLLLINQMCLYVTSSQKVLEILMFWSVLTISAVSAVKLQTDYTGRQARRARSSVPGRWVPAPLPAHTASTLTVHGLQLERYLPTWV